MTVESHELSYIPKYVKIYEIVHPNTYSEYEKLGQLDRLWWVFDPRLLWTLDQLRELYGAIIINTWYKRRPTGGYTVNNNGFRERGLRDLNSTTGAKLSMHKFCRAIDCHFNSISAPAIVKSINDAGMFKSGEWRNDSTNKLFNAFKYVTCIERSIGGTPINWLHIDTGNRPIRNGAILALDL